MRRHHRRFKNLLDYRCLALDVYDFVGFFLRSSFCLHMVVGYLDRVRAEIRIARLTLGV